MRILALDPGERIGWARADVDEDGAWFEVRHGITPLRDMALAVHRSPAKETETGLTMWQLEHGADPKPEPDYDLVIMEDWRLYPHMAKTMVGSAFPSVQFVGMVKLCCWLSNTKLVTQGAGVMKTALKAMPSIDPELYAKITAPRAHDDAHDMSALTHLWSYCWKNYPLGHAER